jgi:AcrR family transcriptional regulator
MKNTKELILQKARHVFALQGYEAFSIRHLADEIGIAPSVIYHYFKDKDDLLKEMYETTNIILGEKRAKLPQSETASEMLRQRIEFQVDNAEEIVAVLKYYMAYRKNFKKFNKGFIPDKSALHMEEVLQYGVKTGEFKVLDLEDDAKVMTHAINGFLLEYYPYKPKGMEKYDLVQRIYNFLIRALKGGDNK